MGSVPIESRSRTRTRIVRLCCSILLSFILIEFGGDMVEFGGNLRLHGAPVYFYCHLIQRTLESAVREDQVISELGGIDDLFERLRLHKEILRQKQMGMDLDSDTYRDYFFAIGKVHEQRVVAEAFDKAHQETMKNYAITARYSQRTSNELAKQAEASQLTRERLDKLNSILSDEVENLRVLRKQTEESLEMARTIQEKLLERERFLDEIRAFFGRGPLWVIWEYVQWIFDLVLDFLIEKLLCFEAFILDDRGHFGSASYSPE